MPVEKFSYPFTVGIGVGDGPGIGRAVVNGWITESSSILEGKVDLSAGGIFETAEEARYDGNGFGGDGTVLSGCIVGELTFSFSKTETETGSGGGGAIVWETD